MKTNEYLWQSFQSWVSRSFSHVQERESICKKNNNETKRKINFSGNHTQDYTALAQNILK